MSADVSTKPPTKARPKVEKPPVAPVPDAPERDELERLDPQPMRMVLKSGTEFDVQPLKLRQFLALLRIVTRGASGILSMGGLSSQDGEDFVRQLLALVLFAVPEAEDETINFIQTMTVPAHLTGDPIKDQDLINALNEELDNPELEDMVSIIEAIVDREGDDLRALGNRLRSMFKTAEKMGLTNEKSLTD